MTLTGQVLGADRAGVVFNKKYDRIPITLRESYNLDKDVARHLSRNYGTRALQVGAAGGMATGHGLDYATAAAPPRACARVLLLHGALLTPPLLCHCCAH